MLENEKAHAKIFYWQIFLAISDAGTKLRWKSIPPVIFKVKEHEFSIYGIGEQALLIWK